VVIVEEVDAGATLALRGQVLREGRVHDGFPEDEWPATLHLAVRQDGRVVGVATFIPREEGVWQLRGMAVDPEVQGRGIGRALLEAAAGRLRAAGGRSAWANGRDTALGFYERLGWRTVGDGYVMAGIPHHRTELDL
jgi:GNAT superfamily N-acetyltransferase